MCCRIGCGCRTDIASLDISDNYQILGFAVFYCLVKSHQSGNTELFIHGNLRFYCRDQIISLINDFLIKKPDGFCSTLQVLAFFLKSNLLDMFRYEFHHRVKTYYNGRTCLANLLYKFVDHNFLLYLISSLFLSIVLSVPH